MPSWRARGWVARARITQIMNLLHPAAPIQDEILHWPDGTSQREPVSERALRRLTQIPSWSKQLELWRQLLPAATETAVSRLPSKSTRSLIRFRFVARDNNQHSFHD